MSTHTNEDDPAFPAVARLVRNNPETGILITERFTDGGLTAREHAAIHLRVPMSGNPWLDEMITEARRWDAAQAAMPSYYDQDRVACISNAVHDANALTCEMKGGER
jgi:hypothetical protein